MAEKETIPPGIFQEPLSETGSIESGSDMQRKFPDADPVQIIPGNQDLGHSHRDDSNGFQSLAHNVGGSNSLLTVTQPTISKNPSLEENPKSETKQALNTVIGTAPPSKSSSTLSDTCKGSHPEECSHKMPEAVSSHEDGVYDPVSPNKSETTFVSVKDHRKSLDDQDSKMKTLQKKAELEEKQNVELKQQKEELFETTSTLRKQSAGNYQQMKELTENHQATHEKLMKEQEEKQRYERENSSLENELRLANEEIEKLKQRNKELEKTVSKLFKKLDEETRQREALQREVRQLKEMFEKKCT